MDSIIGKDNEAGEIINPPLTKTKRGGSRAVYYVSEAELWEDTMELYKTGEFPERLATNLLKMVKRILTSRRFNQYPDMVKEDCESMAILHVVAALQAKKFDPKRGSKVYSWASRVILNECLQCLQREAKRNKFYEELVNECIVNDEIEFVGLF